MDTRTTLSRDEALGLVRRYKQVIAPRFSEEPRVILFGSYSKGFEISKGLWRDTRQVSFLIEPVLLAEDRWSPLYEDVMRTGIAV